MIEFHRLLLGDTVRNDALFRALEHVIIPGKTTVTDIGSGTGFLSFLAEKLGAKSCTLYESNPDALALSRKIARANGIRRCRFVLRDSTSERHPVKTDVVITETLGNFAYEEHILETMEDAKRFLKPGGTLIPEQIRQFVCPIIRDHLWKELNVWDGIGHSLDFSAAKNISLQNMYVKSVLPGDLLEGKDAVQEWDSVDLRKRIHSVRSGSAQWRMRTPQTITGLCLFWKCMLTPGISLSTSPFDPRTHWEQIFLPLFSPVPLHPEETLIAELTSDTRRETGLRVTWEVTVRERGGAARARQKLDSGKGYTR